LYWPTAVELVRVWSVDPNYSHGFIVPVVSLLFAGLAWKRFGIPIRGHVAAGTVTLGAMEILLGLGLHILGWMLGHLLFDVLSLVCVLRGTLLVLGGADANRAFGFAALFLLFMAPLPMAWHQPLAIELQQIVSGLSAYILEACGVATYREGYVIHLSVYSMEVGAACSGLRQLTAVLALGVALGHLANRGAWFTGVLALVSLPVAIVANCARVVITGIIAVLFGPKWAEGVFHTLEGLAVVALAALLIVGVASGLARFHDRWKVKKEPSHDKAENVG
jgi:exosortase